MYKLTYVGFRAHVKIASRIVSLMACYADINVSQGSVATYARCGGILNIHLATNLPKNLPVFFKNRLRFDRIMVMSLCLHFFWPTP